MRTTLLAVALGTSIVVLVIGGLSLTFVASAVHDCDTYGATDACQEVADHPLLAAWVRR